ncbi:hypothetical protein K432DRAFT_432052 [Lepidopterella palustris CBS 459.81]|uniref:Uncharacterized protein n=1 Tax=Lepidopterella palustris CBS 459.81 TaxID=1314670 RepID=A0A8E2EJ33_9PEZI|nr:hypothetical protein K432DRAFT_432052 [Lepidopterella palustris CBS 459.81]
MPPWSLISPASRGISFALARYVLRTTDARAVAIARRDLEKTKENILSGQDNIDGSRLTVLKLVKTFDNHLRAMASGDAIAVALYPSIVKKGQLFEKEWVAERLVEVMRGAWCWRERQVLGLG